MSHSSHACFGEDLDFFSANEEVRRPEGAPRMRMSQSEANPKPQRHHHFLERHRCAHVEECTQSGASGRPGSGAGGLDRPFLASSVVSSIWPAPPGPLGLLNVPSQRGSPNSACILLYFLLSMVSMGHDMTLQKTCPPAAQACFQIQNYSD